MPKLVSQSSNVGGRVTSGSACFRHTDVERFPDRRDVGCLLADTYLERERLSQGAVVRCCHRVLVRHASFGAVAIGVSW